MKVISIGRGDSNTIQIDNEFVSRQHALLMVYPSGKMELIDKSTNGTAINGRKIKSNVAYRVHRKDVITFAGQAQLDWKDVPDPLKGLKIALIALAALLVLLAGFFIIRNVVRRNPTPDPLPNYGYVDEGYHGADTTAAKSNPAPSDNPQDGVKPGSPEEEMMKALKQEEEARAARQKKQREEAAKNNPSQKADPKSGQQQEQPKDSSGIKHLF